MTGRTTFIRVLRTAARIAFGIAFAGIAIALFVSDLAGV